MVSVSLGCRRSAIFFDVVEQRLQEQAVGRLQDHQAHAVAPQAPLLPATWRAFSASIDTCTAVMSWERAQRVAQRDHRAAVHAADGQDHAVAQHARRRAVVLEREAPAQPRR